MNLCWHTRCGEDCLMNFPGLITIFTQLDGIERSSRSELRCMSGRTCFVNSRCVDVVKVLRSGRSVVSDYSKAADLLPSWLSLSQCVIDVRNIKWWVSSFHPTANATLWPLSSERSLTIRFSILSPQKFVQGLSILSRGTLEEKLCWTFQLYDINSDGQITKEEMSDIVTAIYNLMAHSGEEKIDEDRIKAKVDRIFDVSLPALSFFDLWPVTWKLFSSVREIQETFEVVLFEVVLGEYPTKLKLSDH